MEKVTEVQDSAAAVDEAVRALSDAAQHGAEEVVEHSRVTLSSFLAENAAINRKLYAAWVSGAEDLLTAGVAYQKAVLGLGPQLFEARAAASRSRSAQWQTLMDEQYKALLGIWRQAVELPEKFLPPVR